VGEYSLGLSGDLSAGWAARPDPEPPQEVFQLIISLGSERVWLEIFVGMAGVGSIGELVVEYPVGYACSGSGSEFSEDVPDVSFDGFDLDEEFLGDLLVG
jgi:hypothetical protein